MVRKRDTACALDEGQEEAEAKQPNGHNAEQT